MNRFFLLCIVIFSLSNIANARIFPIGRQNHPMLLNEKIVIFANGKKAKGKVMKTIKKTLGSSLDSIRVNKSRLALINSKIDSLNDEINANMQIISTQGGQLNNILKKASSKPFGSDTIPFDLVNKDFIYPKK